LKRKKIILLIGLLLALTLSGCDDNGLYRLILVTDNQHTINTPTSGTLVILNGDVTITEDAGLDGDAHLVSGKLTLKGPILGDVSALGGTLVLGENASIRGVLNHGGGTLDGSDAGNVAGKINTGTGIQIPEINIPQQTQSIGGLAARWLVSAALAGVLALGLNRYLPYQLRLVGETSVKHVLVATAMGILIGIVGLTLIVLLAYTIVLIPVALLGFFILVFSMVYGWIAFALFLGQLVAAQLAASKPRWFVFGSVFIVFLAMNMVGAIPAAGGIASILFGIISLGAVFLTRFGLRRFIPENVFAQSEI
jgi:hypothetical protein